ncbi:MAG: hypothetical protein UY85_C0051G0002 [Candidatus Peribacteria bacterium GW2011_GWB1_54_5]|nr:MAG: hypothetical protein UY85_C0051G0002 [Candidatus Peribacteria bacterium GW2011_GWB1_54_5]
MRCVWADEGGKSNCFTKRHMKPDITIDEATDPRTLAQPPFVECPRCHKQTNGVWHIGVRCYLRLCSECPMPDPNRGEKPEMISLPKIEKKVIYLDQHVISSMAKALRPELQRTQKMETRIQEDWIKLFRKLDRLRRLQMIVSLNH